jgi:1-acyl-sn-glycerol-3-phosphate acyltransferase
MTFPPGLPPVSNKFVYCYRVAMKWFSFFVFGLGSLILATAALPAMRLFLHPASRFKKYGRRLVYITMRFFVALMHVIGVVDLNAEPRSAYRELSSKIAAANHPSLLDVVMLFSLIPNADCIVNTGLRRNIVRGIVNQLYIVNSLNFEDLLEECRSSLAQGNCIIIFPEGTRTPREGSNPLKKGAARIALSSGCAVVPVHIGGTDKFGLGKKDPWAGFNPAQRYVYDLTMKKEILPQNYAALSAPLSAKAMTAAIKEAVFEN